MGMLSYLLNQKINRCSHELFYLRVLILFRFILSLTIKIFGIHPGKLPANLDIFNIFRGLSVLPEIFKHSRLINRAKPNITAMQYHRRSQYISPKANIVWKHREIVSISRCFHGAGNRDRTCMDVLRKILSLVRLPVPPYPANP